MDIKSALNHLVAGESLSREDMQSVMQDVMTGKASAEQIAGLLIALRMKGETVDEIAAAAQVMRDLATPVKASGPHMVDIVGTGGDGASIFNVSTASSFVAAAAGAQVAKHGNRSVSSSSGAADVLEAAGVRLDLNADEVARCIDELNLGFMFAVNHHSAMRHAIGPRRELGLRTIFNVLGPLTNPAGVRKQLLGVYDERWLKPLAEVLNKLGAEHVLVVHSDDGLDEISIAAATQVVELHNGQITEYRIQPEDFGLQRATLDGLVVGDADASLALIKTILHGEPSSAADIVCLNAGAALYAADVCDSLATGVQLAQQTIQSGAAAQKLQAFAHFTQSLKQ